MSNLFFKVKILESQLGIEFPHLAKKVNTDRQLNWHFR